MNKMEMGMGAPKTPEEKKIPKITKEEWQEFCNLPKDDPKLLNWMKEKGIEFDQGIIEVEQDGKIKEMVTDKKDFGTFTYNEREINE